MVSNAIDTDILIVGAGPVGLFLANECARHNLKWRLIEERSSQSEHSKALAIFPRTLEIFDMAGIVTPFLEKANRVTKVAVMTHDRTLARLHFEPKREPVFVHRDGAARRDGEIAGGRVAAAGRRR